MFEEPTMKENEMFSFKNNYMPAFNEKEKDAKDAKYAKDEKEEYAETKIDPYEVCDGRNNNLLDIIYRYKYNSSTRRKITRGHLQPLLTIDSAFMLDKSTNPIKLIYNDTLQFGIDSLSDISSTEIKLSTIPLLLVCIDKKGGHATLIILFNINIFSFGLGYDEDRINCIMASPDPMAKLQKQYIVKIIVPFFSNIANKYLEILNNALDISKINVKYKHPTIFPLTIPYSFINSVLIPSTWNTHNCASFVISAIPTGTADLLSVARPTNIRSRQTNIPSWNEIISKRVITSEMLREMYIFNIKYAKGLNAWQKTRRRRRTRKAKGEFIGTRTRTKTSKAR